MASNHRDQADRSDTMIDVKYEQADNDSAERSRESSVSSSFVAEMRDWKATEAATAPSDDLMEQSEVLDELLESMYTAGEEELESILVAIEELIPVAASLNVRSPISQDVWRVASTTFTLPTINIGKIGKIRASLLERILWSAEIVQDNARFIEALLTRVLLPCVAKLKENTELWTSIFLLKHGIDPLEVALPPLPGSAVVWDIIIMGTCSSGYMPVSLLEEVTAWYVFNINPPANIVSLNERLRSVPLREMDPAAQAWLEMYGLGHKVLNSKHVPNEDRGADPTIWYLGIDTAQNSIINKRARELFLELFVVALLHDSHKHEMVENFFRHLTPSSFSMAWVREIKPVVQAMVLYVERMRTKAWLSDPNRRPKHLPDVYQERLWLLDYPKQLDDREVKASMSASQLLLQRKSMCKKLAHELSKEVDGLVGTVVYDRFAYLQECAKRVEGLDCIRVAVRLGDIRTSKLSWLTVQDQLRVDLAATFLEESHLYSLQGAETENQREEAMNLQREANALLRTWRNSESERVRKAGWNFKLNWFAEMEGDGEEDQGRAEATYGFTIRPSQENLY